MHYKHKLDDVKLRKRADDRINKVADEINILKGMVAENSLLTTRVELLVVIDHDRGKQVVSMIYEARRKQ